MKILDCIIAIYHGGTFILEKAKHKSYCKLCNQVIMKKRKRVFAYWHIRRHSRLFKWNFHLDCAYDIWKQHSIDDKKYIQKIKRGITKSYLKTKNGDIAIDKL